MKAIIEDGVLWIGSETYEEIIITDKWEKDNKEAIAILNEKGKKPKIAFRGIILKSSKNERI